MSGTVHAFCIEKGRACSGPYVFEIESYEKKREPAAWMVRALAREAMVMLSAAERLFGSEET